jgi:hypothetical protein
LMIGLSFVFFVFQAFTLSILAPSRSWRIR